MIFQRRLTQAPATPLRVDPRYRPIGGIQPAGWGFYDTSSQVLTIGITAGRRPEAITFSGLSSTRIDRNNLTGIDYPLSFVFRGTVNSTGVMVLGNMASSVTGQYNRVYAWSDSVWAQVQGSTIDAQAGSGTVLAGAALFTCVAVFKDGNTRSIYVQGPLGYSAVTETTATGTINSIGWLTFGQYYNGGTALYHQDGTTQIAQWLGVELSAIEARALLVNPWALFAPLPRRLWAPAPSAPPASLYASLGQFHPTMRIEAWF